MFENKLAYISHTQLCKSEILSVYVCITVAYFTVSKLTMEAKMLAWVTVFILLQSHFRLM